MTINGTEQKQQETLQTDTRRRQMDQAWITMNRWIDGINTGNQQSQATTGTRFDALTNLKEGCSCSAWYAPITPTGCNWNRSRQFTHMVCSPTTIMGHQRIYQHAVHLKLTAVGHGNSEEWIRPFGWADLSTSAEASQCKLAFFVCTEHEKGKSW